MSKQRRCGPILGSWLIGCLVATAGPVVAAPDDPPRIAPEADAVIRRMSDFFKETKAFRVDVTRRMSTGVIPITQTVGVAFERPNRLAIRNRSFLAGQGFDIISDGTTVTAVVGPFGKYAQQPAPASLTDLPDGDDIKFLFTMNLIGTTLPELMTDDPYKALMDGVKSATYVGLEDQATGKSHHIRLTKESSNSRDLWVSSQGDPLPGHVKLSPADGAKEGGFVSMDISFTLRNWKIGVPEEGTFAFEPPPRYKKVDTIGAAMGMDSLRDGLTSPLVGKPAPAIRLGADGGGTFDLADQRGKIVLLDFWATWCGPCVKELPLLTEVAEAYRDQGVVFRTINLREDAAKVAEFQKAKGLFFPVAYDTDHKVADAYGVSGIPTTVLVDKAGVVRAVHVGYNPAIRSQLVAELDALLAGRDLAPTTVPAVAPPSIEPAEFKAATPPAAGAKP